MTFEEVINNDLKDAMKAKDAVALRGIRAIKSAILLAKTDGSGLELDETRKIQMLQKMIKQRSDSFEIYKNQGREDLAKVEAEEMDIIRKYLPEQLSESAVIEKLEEIIARLGATSAKDMGKVMGVASKELAGKVEGKVIAEKVKELLN